MLIPSRRHRQNDLLLWAELEDADSFHGELLMRSGKVQKSIAAIIEFASTACYCSTSWGKDSVVMMDLVCRANARIPCVWMTYGIATNPGCYAVRDEFLRTHRGIDYHEIDVGAEESARDDYSEAVRMFGTDRYILGIRAGESGVRKMSLRMLGIDTGRACRPLGWWSIDDVFGYLAVNDLPVHQNYAMLGGGRWPREHIRTASIGGERGIENGRGEWEREYYGDVLNKTLVGR